MDYTARLGGGDSGGIEDTFWDLLMDMTWAEKEIEDSGITLRFGALAVSKRGASSCHGGHWEGCSTLAVGNPPLPSSLLSKGFSGSSHQAFDECLFKENVGPAIKES